MFNWENVLSNVNGGGPIPPSKVEKSLVEWKKNLTSEQFYVTRQKALSVPIQGELCSFYEPGKYACVCCSTELFDSSLKFDSGTGWPSFSEPVADDVIQYESDTTYGQRVKYSATSVMHIWTMSFRWSTSNWGEILYQLRVFEVCGIN